MNILIRSVVFNLLFYLNVVVHVLGGVPTFFMPYWGAVEIAKSWGRTNLWLLRVICGIRVEFRGLEKIPQGPLIVASKHQSALETFALLPLFANPTFILKRELQWIPLFGWLTWKGRMIPVDRGAGSQALADMTDLARIEIRRGRQLIIFPEGTRRPPGAEPKYKFGVAHLYAEIGVPCLPIALNSGMFWRRRAFLRYPGTVVVEILDPILPGLDKQAFFSHLQQVTEAATARLIAEAEQKLGRTAASIEKEQSAVS